MTGELSITEQDFVLKKLDEAGKRAGGCGGGRALIYKLFDELKQRWPNSSYNY